MLSSSIRLLTIPAFLLMTATFSADGQVVVEDTNITLNDRGPMFGIERFTATVVQEIDSGGDSTSFDFDLTVLLTPSIPPVIFRHLTGGDTTSPRGGSDWYVAEAGELFSLNTIETGNFSPLSVTQSLSSGGGEDSFSPSLPPTGDFFLAVTTANESSSFLSFVDNELVFTRDVFGWAQFGFDESGNFAILDNAVAYGTGNIIIGENAFAVPEPSAAAVLAFCGLGLLRRSRRSSIAG